MIHRYDRYDAFFQIQEEDQALSAPGGSDSGKLELLFLDIDLSTGYKCGNGDGHCVVVFRIGNRWRVVQAFAFKLSLADYLGTTHWMGAEEANEWWRHCKIVAFADTSEIDEARASTTPFLGIPLETDAASFQKRNGFNEGRSVCVSLVTVDPNAFLGKCQEFLQAWTKEMRA